MAHQEDNDRAELAKKSFERLKLVSQGLTGTQAARAACRLSKWANPTYAQWKDINRTITKDMIKAVWPCPESEIAKGRWKISKCLNEDIKANAEKIYLEVYGHPLHNADSPLYFAKMLYHEFIDGRHVDFASKETNVTVHDIRQETVTFTREECRLMVEGAELELTKVKETWSKRLQDKEQEATRVFQAAQTPPASQAKVEAHLTQLRQDVQGLSQRLHPGQCQGNHISHFLSHPEVINPGEAGSSGGGNICPTCEKIFDSWSGHYMLSCNHYYHIVCLIRLMQTGSACLICNKDIPEGLYLLFGMPGDYKLRQRPVGTPSALRNLFAQEGTGDNDINAPPQ